MEKEEGRINKQGATRDGQITQPFRWQIEYSSTSASEILVKNRRRLSQYVSLRARSIKVGLI